MLLHRTDGDEDGGVLRCQCSELWRAEVLPEHVRRAAGGQHLFWASRSGAFAPYLSCAGLGLLAAAVGRSRSARGGALLPRRAACCARYGALKTDLF
eukprot:COSAG05_NODE_1523_length_4641_cov_5.853589_5_plen_97_part_00